MLDYLGASRQKLDDRGRLHLPVRWSEHVGRVGEMVLTAGPSQSLMLLEQAVWKRTVKQIGFEVLCGTDRRQLRALFVGHAESVSVDKAGRILITEALRIYAGLEDLNRVYLVGTGHWIEIWAQKKWDEEIASALTKPELFELSDPGSHDPEGEPDA